MYRQLLNRSRKNWQTPHSLTLSSSLTLPCTTRTIFSTFAWSVPLRLSKRTEYGLRAVVQLARLYPKTFVQAHDLAQQEELPNKFLESILLSLRRGGFLESKVGSGGGYRLARPPRQISVGDLIRRLEGRLTVKDPQPTQESSPGKIAVRFLNDKLSAATDLVIDHLNLDDLLEQVNRGASLQQMYYI